MFRRFFGRVRDVRAQAERWRRGDLAVCVRADWEEVDPTTPAIGEVLRVIGVEDGESKSVRTIYLTFAGRSPRVTWDARGFRKAAQDRSPAEASFADLIRMLGERPQPLPVADPVAVPAAAGPSPLHHQENDHA